VEQENVSPELAHETADNDSDGEASSEVVVTEDEPESSEEKDEPEE
jgi:hypothetical protein